MNHFKISLIKSILRIVGCFICIALTIIGIAFWVNGVVDAYKVPLTGAIINCSFFLVAEVLGILEEIFDKRKE